jgi:hypothetical protein
MTIAINITKAFHESIQHGLLISLQSCYSDMSISYMKKFIAVRNKKAFYSCIAFF